MDQLTAWLTLYGLRALGALVLLVVGLSLARVFTSSVRRLLQARELDKTLVNFGTNILYAMLVVFVVVAALGQLGIQTTSVIAVLGAAGLAVGLALQSSLANFAAGVMILVFRPFSVTDVIEAAGVIGVVEDIHIFTTRLRTGDNKTVFIPNGKLVSDNLINYSRKGTRRLDLVIGVSYGDDIRKVKEVLSAIVGSDERVLADPAPTIAVLELAESSVNFAVRPWVNVADYWPVYFSLMENIKLGLDEAGISIPFPQRDVHLIPTGSAADKPS